MTCDHSHVADGEVVLASKVGVKMFIRNSSELSVSLFMSDMLFMGHVPFFSAPLLVSLVLLFLVCFVTFFFVYFFSFPIPVLVLSSSSNSTPQQK
jgi:hypothetical protein